MFIFELWEEAGVSREAAAAASVPLPVGHLINLC